MDLAASPRTPEATPPSVIKTGMACFLLSEAAFFGTLLMAYTFFLRQTVAGEPNPRQVFYLPLVLAGTACLLLSSATVHQAERMFHRGPALRSAPWWLATILLGGGFLGCTAWEWNELIRHWGLTISRNMFGTTYYTLVGFHALHVTVGLIVMTILLLLLLRRQVDLRHADAATAVAWYWHFVDAVWLAVLTLVYFVGR